MPSRGAMSVLEWKLRAEKVALHDPYVLVFFKSFIWVRYASTGELVQTIQAESVRFLWNAGTNTSIKMNTITESPRIHQNARVHGVMLGSSSSHGVYEHVFELMLTIPTPDGTHSDHYIDASGFQVG